MANLLASLISSTGAVRAFDRVLETTQNNVANVTTPGFARQRQTLTSLPFDPQRGTGGGVWAGEVRSARDQWAEAAVRRRSVALGESSQTVDSLTSLEGVLDISAGGAIPDALSRLYESFSNWGMTPNSASVRQEVINRASDAAAAFGRTAAALQDRMREAEGRLGETVDRINQLGGELLNCNLYARQGGGKDAAHDARVNSLLDELSGLVGFTSVLQEDGSTTVLLGGEVPLTAGDNLYEISFSVEQPEDPPAVYAGGPPAAVIRSAFGSDITSRLSSGKTGALLDCRNRVLGGLMGSAAQAGELNRLALAFAGRVNEILTSGSVVDATPAQPGMDLFTWQPGNDTAAAATLAIAEGLGPGDLAAIDPGPPSVSNGIPLRLAKLAAPDQDGDRIDTRSYVEQYGALAGRVGRELSDATRGMETQQSLLAQAKQLREDCSGVSLDEEAAILIQFQRAYQATSRLVQVLNELTEEMINLMG